MLTRIWPPRKRLAVAAIVFVIVIVFATFSNLQYRPSRLITSLQIPSYKGNNTVEQEIIGNATFLRVLAPSYVKAILDPKNKEFDRLQCPAPTPKRYDYLQVDRGKPTPKRYNYLQVDRGKPTPKRYNYLQVDRRNTKTTDGQIQYFFALNLRHCVGILPRLMGSIVETIQFLGPEICALSIVEGNSKDGTLEVLETMRKDIRSRGIEYHLQTSDIDPTIGDRIEALARLRNLALEPLINSSSQYSPDTAVIFINDVAICMEDILELVHQRVYQKADMTCAMDWSDIGDAPIFYDIWIARAINGDTFWEIPPDGGWRFSSNLFWNHPTSRQRYDEHKAFQVFACWNGAVVFTAKPIMQKKIRFRRSKPGECFSGEPRLLCKDLWMEGYSKIAVVPSVNLEYTDKSAKKAKALHGYVSDSVKGENVSDTSLRIEWDDKPPEMVKCMADFADQSWVPWNQGFESKS